MKKELENDKHTDVVPSSEVQQPLSKKSVTDIESDRGSFISKKKTPTTGRKKRGDKKRKKSFVETYEEKVEKQYCCADNCLEIKDSDRNDDEGGQEIELIVVEQWGQKVEYDEYGVPKNGQDTQLYNNNEYTEGIKRL